MPPKKKTVTPAEPAAPAKPAPRPLKEHPVFPTGRSLLEATLKGFRNGRGWISGSLCVESSCSDNMGGVSKEPENRVCMLGGLHLALKPGADLRGQNTGASMKFITSFRVGREAFDALKAIDLVTSHPRTAACIISNGKELRDNIVYIFNDSVAWPKIHKWMRQAIFLLRGVEQAKAREAAELALLSERIKPAVKHTIRRAHEKLFNAAQDDVTPLPVFKPTGRSAVVQDDRALPKEAVDAPSAPVKVRV